MMRNHFQNKTWSGLTPLKIIAWAVFAPKFVPKSCVCTLVCALDIEGCVLAHSNGSRPTTYELAEYSQLCDTLSPLAEAKRPNYLCWFSKDFKFCCAKSVHTTQ